MKTMILTAVMALSSSALSQDVVVKECSVTMKHLESNKTVDMTMKVIAKGNVLSSVITQTADGNTSSSNDVAEVQEEKVRANLTVQSDPNDLNQAEGLIVHAMILSEAPELEGAYSAGIDLKKVRSAKMYTVGEKTRMGSATIVEAHDENNQVLGSFLGGFLVSPCK